MNNGLHLNTYGFTLQEVELLIKVLMNKFELKCSIHMKNNQPSPRGSHLRVCTPGARIFIYNKSINTLKSLVISHMHPSMLYKLSL